MVTTNESRSLDIFFLGARSLLELKSDLPFLLQLAPARRTPRRTVGVHCAATGAAGALGEVDGHDGFS